MNRKQRRAIAKSGLGSALSGATENLSEAVQALQGLNGLPKDINEKLQELGTLVDSVIADQAALNQEVETLKAQMAEVRNIIAQRL